MIVKPAQAALIDIPRSLEAYPSAADQTLAEELAARIQVEPLNAIATAIFALAIFVSSNPPLIHLRLKNFIHSPC